MTLSVLVVVLGGCATDQTTADGQVIPGKHALQLGDYEYICRYIESKNLTDLEKNLDRYGAQGWRLAGFTQTGGTTTGYCLVR